MDPKPKPNVTPQATNPPDPAATVPEAPGAAPATTDPTHLLADTIPVSPGGQKTSPVAAKRESQPKVAGRTPAQSPAKPATQAKPISGAKPPATSSAATEAFTDKPGPVAAPSVPATKVLEATAEFKGSETSTADALVSKVIGDFRLDQKLGEGGMGAVFKAHQISMDRTVALKLLAKNLANNQGFVERFYREARTMAKLDHPNIVRGYAVGEVDGQHFVAMEFVDGMSMQKWMNSLGRLPVGDAVHIILCSAYALQHAHEQNLIHRDIKPDNILITNRGVVKVADLGLAKKTDDNLSLTQSGTGFGTPFYMPLEQYRDAKHVDARADVYALGITLYYALTGKLPFLGATHFDVIKAKEAAKFIPARRHNPEIPERLDLMIDKMIQKEKAHRYQSCAEVIEALETLGLANEALSFVGASQAAAAGKAAAPTVRPSTLPPRPKTVAATRPIQETPDMWVLRYRDERGQKVKKQVSSGRLKQLIEQDEIDIPSATVARPGEEIQRPLSSVPELSSLVQSKMVKAKADRRSQKLDSAYEKLERDARRQKLFKTIKNLLRSLTSLLILAAVLAGLVFGGLWLFRNKDSVIQKVQDAAKGEQQSPNTPGQPNAP